MCLCHFNTNEMTKLFPIQIVLLWSYDCVNAQSHEVSEAKQSRAWMRSLWENQEAKWLVCEWVGLVAGRPFGADLFSHVSVALPQGGSGYTCSSHHDSPSVVCVKRFSGLLSHEKHYTNKFPFYYIMRCNSMMQLRVKMIFFYSALVCVVFLVPALVHRASCLCIGVLY